MKVIILGGSIAGSAMALALSEYADVSVYEQKSEEMVSKKVCANICTHSIKKLAWELGLDENFILNKYESINVFSRKNKATFPTEDYEIDRGRLLRQMIKKARENSTEFHFKTKFLKYEKSKNGFEVFFEDHSRQFSDRADVLIAADGALSPVAKQSKSMEKRKFFLFLQANVYGKRIKKSFRPSEGSYNIFVDKNFGYYAYIFPSASGKYKIGLGDDPENDVRLMFRLFVEKLGIDWKKLRIEGALIPKPLIVKNQKNLFFVGDSSCNVKYSGGGIVPSIEQAIALRDKIIGKGDSRIKMNINRLRNHCRLTCMIQKMNNDELDSIIETLSGKKYGHIFEDRDEMTLNDFISLLSPRLLFLGISSLLRRN